MSGSRIDANKADILISVVNLLIKQVPDFLSDKNCYISMYPELPYNFADQWAICVSPMGGTFTPGHQAGGGKSQCTEESSIFVTIFSRYKADRAGRDINALADQTRGVMRLQQHILAALVVCDPQVPTPGQSGTDSVLRDLMEALESSNPEHDNSKDYISYGTRFSMNFDWALVGIPTIT